MAVVLALTMLFDAVVARFTADAAPSAPVAQVFGAREPARHPASAPAGTRRRIVWVPGDDKNGDLGKLGPPKSPGRDPRPLATLHELFTVYVESGDFSSAAAAENERTQYQACRELFDAWYAAAWGAAGPRLQVQSAAWVRPEAPNRRAGGAIRILATIEAMLPDAPYTSAPVDVGADVSTTEKNVTEHTIVTSPAKVAATTAITLSGLQTIDGVALVEDDRVLVTAQAAGATNGLYSAKPGAWVRTADADTSGEMPSGRLVGVALGANAGDWVLTTPAPIVLGTTPLTFARVT